MNKYENALKKKQRNRTYESRLSIKIKEDEWDMIRFLMEKTDLDLRGVIYLSMKQMYDSLKNDENLSEK